MTDGLAGVNWGPPSADVEYNYPDTEEVCRCRRVNEAWPVQLLHDNSSWAQKHHLDLDYQACHGSWFRDITDQVRRLNQSTEPDIGFLMIGGNPGGFPKIVEDCVFQYERGKDYGPEYPDPEGQCYKTLKEARRTVHSPAFLQDLASSIYQILNEPRIRMNMAFRLFIVSYSGLFNHDDHACDDWTFGIWGGKKPKLTTELRRAINEIIDEGRFLYEVFINHILFDPRVQYLDANHVLQGHRFCEPTPEGTFEAQKENAWLYSLEWPACIPWTTISEDGQENATTTWPSFCRNCGGFGGLGDFQRPFHPKREGHKAIKDFLVEVLKREVSW